MRWPMKVALIHDYLNQYGGAERVLEVLLDIFPDAHIFTLLYSPERTSARFRRNVHKTSLLDFSLARHHHRIFIPLMPAAVRSLRVENHYDLILSDSAGYAKGVPQDGHAFHLSYCYTPLRYAWEIQNYFSNPVFKTLFAPIFRYLRSWDYRAAQKPDVLLAVSGFIAGKIRQYYGRAASVVYPPVNYDGFYYDPPVVPAGSSSSYYLAAGRLLHYKKFSLLVEAFLELGRNLWIVGTGPEMPKLEQMSGRSGRIRLLGNVTDSELRALYCGAQAFLFPQVEDFGLVAAEALACGTPVIAYAGGGSLEIVQEGATGIFFREQSVESIVDAVRRFELMDFDRREIAAGSRNFSAEKFRAGILQSLPSGLRRRMGLE